MLSFSVMRTACGVIHKINGAFTRGSGDERVISLLCACWAASAASAAAHDDGGAEGAQEDDARAAGHRCEHGQVEAEDLLMEFLICSVCAIMSIV